MNGELMFLCFWGTAGFDEITHDFFCRAFNWAMKVL